ncbi:inositol monophosphatase family protein [Streptomyces xiaopingdaonensis]|uniref:inositol monophosphatase family protein n=1 Tax=Streptomyces xiaopingdaonensis TaxID=1565415 RepID=UPI0002FF86FA|nr:inositol monophosphatase family protein [Streptomyces xiaopingdaonensis]
MFPERLLSEVEEAVREAVATEVLPRRQRLGAEEVFEKAGPHDLATVADRAAEAHLSAALTALLPGSAVVGEESVYADPGRYAALEGDGWVWIVDPIDGTRHFVSGAPEFSTLVALARGGETVASWTYAPVLGLFATAVRGGGAALGGEPLAAPEDRGAPLDVAFSFPDADADDAAQRRALAALRDSPPDTLAARPTGSAGLEYLAVAAGELDAVAYTWEAAWDHAAGQLLVAEVGGATRTFDGAPFRLRGRNALPFVSARDEPTVRRVLGALGG